MAIKWYIFKASHFKIPFGQTESRTWGVGCIKTWPSAPFWLEQWGVSTSQQNRIWKAGTEETSR